METSTDQVVTDEVSKVAEETSVETTKEVSSVEDLQQEIDKLKEFTSKNREENAKYRAKNRELRDQYDRLKNDLDSERNKVLEEQGQYKALYEKATQENKSLADEREKILLQMQADKLSSKFKKKALDVGCNDPDLAFMISNQKYQSMIDFEDKANLVVNDRSIDDIIEKMKLDHPVLFKKSPLSLGNNKPLKVTSEPKTLADMTKQEKILKLAELAKRQ